MPQTVSAIDAARELGISYASIRRRLESGEIEAEKRGRAFEIPIETIDQLKAERDARRQ